MKTISCKCGEKLERKYSFKNALCENCKRKNRVVRERKKVLEWKNRKRCEVCHKRSQCPERYHKEIRGMFLYRNGKLELSEGAKKKFGTNYLENLRKCTLYPVNTVEKLKDEP